MKKLSGLYGEIENCITLARNDIDSIDQRLFDGGICNYENSTLASSLIDKARNEIKKAYDNIAGFYTLSKSMSDSLSTDMLILLQDKYFLLSKFAEDAPKHKIDVTAYNILTMGDAFDKLFKMFKPDNVLKIIRDGYHCTHETDRIEEGFDIDAEFAVVDHGVITSILSSGVSSYMANNFEFCIDDLVLWLLDYAEQSLKDQVLETISNYSGIQ